MFIFQPCTLVDSGISDFLRIMFIFMLFILSACMVTFLHLRTLMNINRFDLKIFHKNCMFSMMECIGRNASRYVQKDGYMYICCSVVNYNMFIRGLANVILLDTLNFNGI
ncbi:hypothetical protein ACJX0J_026290 [Zea mays]